MSAIGEQLLAVSSIEKAIEPGSVKVTSAMLRQAEKLPEVAKERMAEAIARTKPGPSQKLAPFDYQRWLELLPPPVTPARLLENVAGWPDPVLANEYAQALGRAWGYLQSIFPLRTREHLTGAENVTPPDTQVAMFRRALAIVEDPLSAIDRIAGEELLEAEVVTLKTAYPALFAMWQDFAWEALIDETAKRRAKDKEWHIPRRKDTMLRRLLEQPQGVSSRANAKAVQDAHAEASEQGEPPPGRPTPAANTDAQFEQSLTRTQAAEMNK